MHSTKGGSDYISVRSIGDAAVLGGDERLGALGGRPNFTPLAGEGGRGERSPPVLAHRAVGNFQPGVDDRQSLA
jgi:hypothetical protein